MDFEIRKGNLILLSVLLATCYQLTVVSPQIIDCPTLMMKIARGVLRIYSQCSKDFMQSLEGDEKEYHRRIDCVMKCVMDRIGLLDELGKVSNVTMQVFFDQYVPEDYHEIGHIMVEGCIEEYAPLMDNEDEDDTCLQYGEFVKCVQGIIAEAC